MILIYIFSYSLPYRISQHLHQLCMRVFDLQSGCCKPPTACTYETGVIVGGEDCYRWNNGIETLCYECDACKAGVLEEIRLDWRKLSVVNILVLVLLITVYAAGCCAFHNTHHAAHPYHPSDDNRMTKVRPRWDYYWYVYYIDLMISECKIWHKIILKFIF